MSDELAISTLTSSPPRQRHFDGSITEAGFCFGAQGLAAAWNLHPDCHNSWTWVPVASQSSIEQVAGFLHLERAVQSSEPISRGDSVQDSLELSDEQPAEAETSSVHLYDYHIVYNASYGVPVLMFQGHATDGRPLEWTEILADMPKAFREAAGSHNRWTFVTQQDHPVLSKPWYMLHPCETGSILQLLMASHAQEQDPTCEGVQKSENFDVAYLAAWLSLAGPTVGLRVPPLLVEGVEVMSGAIVSLA